MDYQTIILIAGILILIVIFTRKAILKQRQWLENPVRPPKEKEKKKASAISDIQFDRQWRSMSYLLFLAALGNLYTAYNSGRSAVETMSTVLWIDCGLSILAAIVAITLWKKKLKDITFLYMGIVILQVMFFMATGKYIVALVHVFPLVLVYMVVKPVWDSMK